MGSSPSSGVVAALRSILQRGAPVAFDTEGANFPTCIGFAVSASEVVVVDTLALRNDPDGSQIWSLIRKIFESPAITKYCWSAGHERAFLAWTKQITLRAYHDAELCWHERWAELPQGLKYAASILTCFPCWTEGVSWSNNDDKPKVSGERLFTYNAYDCAATYALATHPQLQLTGVAAARVAFHTACIEPLTYMSLKGVNYDKEQVEQIRKELYPSLYRAQAKVDAIAGVAVPTDGPTLRRVALRGCCLANKAGLIGDVWDRGEQHTKKDCLPVLQRLRVLSESDLANAAVRGEVGYLLSSVKGSKGRPVEGAGLNVKSTPQVVGALKALHLPVVFAKRERGDDVATESKNIDALLTIYLKTGHAFPVAVLETVALRGRLQELDRRFDVDGRIRCSYQIAAAETDRVLSHEWLTGSGGNLQTVPSKPVNFRRLYRADPGYTFAKADLRGADGWTVACRCAQHGDRTYLDDLKAGLRIPSLLVLALKGVKIADHTREELREQCRSLTKDWTDLAAKRGQHSTSYGAAPTTVRRIVVEDSYKQTGTPIDPGLDVCKAIQHAMLDRYWGLPLWWRAVEDEVKRTGKLRMATGQVREFLSRRIADGKLDSTTRKEALGAEPQAVTTWVTNLALLALWRDPDNWDERAIGVGDPIIQPLLHIHDELCVQFPSDKRAWAVVKLTAYFNNPITIGRETITIPFAGATGGSWGECEEAF